MEQGNEELGMRNGESKRKYKTSLIFYFLFFILSACCSKNHGPNHIRVVLDWTPNTNHTGLYVALEKGWFAKEGLTVEIIQPPEDGALALLGSGSVQFGFDFQETMGPAIAKEFDSMPVKAVAAIICHNSSGIMALKESGICGPRDLMGKRFASWETPLVTTLVKELVEKDGGDFSKVKMVPNFATDALSALQTDIDAIWVYYARDGIAAQVNGINVNFIDIGFIDPCFDFYTPVLAVNTDWLNKNPQTAKTFVHTLGKGYLYAVENHEQAGEILLKHAPELDRKLVMESQKFLASRYCGYTSRWGEIDGIRWEKFYRWMYEKGLLEKDIGQDGFTNELLP